MLKQPVLCSGLVFIAGELSMQRMKTGSFHPVWRHKSWFCWASLVLVAEKEQNGTEQWIKI